MTNKINIVNKDHLLRQIKETVEKPTVIYQDYSSNLYLKDYGGEYWMCLRVELKDEKHGEIIEAVHIPRDEAERNIAKAKVYGNIIYVEDGYSLPRLWYDDEE